LRFEGFWRLFWLERRDADAAFEGPPVTRRGGERDRLTRAGEEARSRVLHNHRKRIGPSRSFWEPVNPVNLGRKAGVDRLEFFTRRPRSPVHPVRPNPRPRRDDGRTPYRIPGGGVSADGSRERCAQRRKRPALIRASARNRPVSFGSGRAARQKMPRPPKQPGGRSGPATRTATGLGSVEWPRAAV
jgi:hypothetical protein